MWATNYLLFRFFLAPLSFDAGLLLYVALSTILVIAIIHVHTLLRYSGKLGWMMTLPVLGYLGTLLLDIFL